MLSPISCHLGPPRKAHSSPSAEAPFLPPGHDYHNTPSPHPALPRPGAPLTGHHLESRILVLAVHV